MRKQAQHKRAKLLLVTPEPFVLELPPGTTDDDIQELLDSRVEHPNLGASGWKEISRRELERKPYCQIVRFEEDC